MAQQSKPMSSVNKVARAAPLTSLPACRSCSQVWLKQHEDVFTLFRDKENEMYVARTQVWTAKFCKRTE